jgi:RimJ/RimL family protein N-acetyltransferase
VATKYSFDKTEISLQDHKRWFFDKVNDPNCYYFIFQRGAEKIGSIRIDYNVENHFGLISYLICTKSQGNGYGKLMLKLLEEFVKSKFENLQLKGLVMKSNQASIRIFDNLGYDLISQKNDIFTFSKIIYK